MTGSRPIITLPPREGELTPPKRPTLTAKRLKVALVLNPDELAGVPLEDGKPRVKLRIRLPDRRISAEISAKSLRKAQTAIREAGVDAVALVLQGCLLEGDIIGEAGLSAQPKAAKP